MSVPVSKNTSLRSRLLSGGSWALSGKVIGSASTLVANMLLARLLSPEEMGSFFLAFSIVTIFTIVAQWGLGRGLVKLVASELASGSNARARSAILSAFIIVTSIGIALALCIYSPMGKWFLNWLTGTSILASIAGFIGLWLLALSLQGIVSEAFRGFHDIRMATIFSGMLTAIISMLLCLFAWFLSGRLDLSDAVGIMVIATAISLFTGSIFLIKKTSRDKRNSKIEITRVFRFGLPLMLTNISLHATLQLHMWILAYIQPETEVALYGASLRLMVLLTMPLMIINAVIPPMIADMYSQCKYDRVQNLLQKTATIISVPALLVFVIIIIFGKEILMLIYGESYMTAYITFVVLIIGQLINILTGSPGVLLTMSGHEHVVFITAMFASILGLITSLIAIQMYGSTGAALGFAVGIITNNLAMCVYAFFKLSIRTYGSIFLVKPIIKSMKYKYIPTR